MVRGVSGAGCDTRLRDGSSFITAFDIASAIRKCPNVLECWIGISVLKEGSPPTVFLGRFPDIIGSAFPCCWAFADMLLGWSKAGVTLI